MQTKSAAMPLPLLLTKKEAAHQLQISIRSLEGLLARHELECRRIGRSVRIPSGALVAFANTYEKYRRKS